MTTWDKHTDKRIALLHPKIKDDVTSFINECYDNGIMIRVTDGFRSFNMQDLLFSKGRDIPGSIVTWVKGGFSFHNYGLAFDICEILEDKSASWDIDTNDNKNSSWVVVRDIANKYGFEWGYDLWRKDKPHFHKSFGYNVDYLNMIFKKGQVREDGYVKI